MVKKLISVLTICMVFFGGLYFNSQTVSAAASDFSWTNHVITAFEMSNDNVEFQIGDFNNDNATDLYVIKKNVGIGNTEVHVLDGASNYASYTVHSLTPFSASGSASDTLYRVGDYNRDGIDDIYVIKKNGITTEIHVLNGASNYTTFLLQTTTILSTTGENFDFQVGDYNNDGILDVYAIAKNNTGTGKTEVHVLNGANNFQSYLTQIGTKLGVTGDNFEFQLGDYNNDGTLDLYAIKKNATDSGTTELHILNGANNFQSYLMQTPTILEQSDKYYQLLIERESLSVYVVKKNWGLGNTELHVMSDSSAVHGITGNDIVEYAKTFLGVPYVWGGSSPSGFDCSGLTQYVYAHFGISISRTTSTQINNGIAVSQANLQLGDLVFTSSGHVGIYVGNNQIIHAPDTGDVVKISTIWSFYAARRIIY